MISVLPDLGETDWAIRRGELLGDSKGIGKLNFHDDFTVLKGGGRELTTKEYKLP